jgi:hypothetical protein
LHDHLNKCRKSLEKNPISLYDKSPEKIIGIEGSYLNIIKAIIYDKPIPSAVLTVEKLKAFPLKSEMKQEYSLHS